MSARNFFSKTDQERIKKAIQDAETNTSGEIRVHIENAFKGQVLDQAAFIFKKLKMTETDLRNGVLFYLAIKNKQFAVLGDVGINQKVPENFWDQIKDTMIDHFKEDDYAGGLVAAIGQAGQKLKEHFPYQSDDINELPDDISFGTEN